MSSIRSASSRTRMRTPSSETILRSMRSCRRPGVATRMCASREALACEPIEIPPYTAATRRSWAGAIVPISAVTWAASSRVGTRIRPDGRASEPSSRSTIGTAKASVLPEPVGDFASTSRPARASGRTRPWIRNGAWMSRSASACAMRADTPSSRKDCIELVDSFVFGRDPPASTACTSKRRENRRRTNLTGRHHAVHVKHGSSRFGRAASTSLGILLRRENKVFS